MIGLKDNDDMDSYFKEAFETLPEQSVGEWDKPSSQVWENIQSGLEAPPPSAKSNNNWAWAAASIGVIGVLAMLWFSQSPSTTSVATQPAAIEQQAEQTAPKAETSIVATPEVETSAPAIETATVQNQTTKRTPAVQTVKSDVVKAAPLVKTTAPVVHSVAQPDIRTALSQKVSVEARNHLEQLNLKQQAAAKTEVAPKKRKFPNTLDRIKAEASQSGAFSKIRDFLLPLPPKPIAPVRHN